MKEQLHKLMEAEGLSPARFADEIGVQRSSISHIISGRNKPSYDFIMKIMNRFEGINVEWLLTGKGSMIKGQDMSNRDIFGTEDLFSTGKGPGKEISSKSAAESSLKSEMDSQTKHSDKNDALPQDTTVPKGKIQAFTNVNDVKYLLIFYQDGSFEQFNPR